LLLEILEISFLALTIIMTAYIVRHFIFTLAVLRSAKNKKFLFEPSLEYEPSVSILIPAHNEEKVIGRLLQQITNFTYPKSKMQVIVIDDASSDQTGKIADTYKSRYPYIDVIHRDREHGANGKASAMNQGFSLCRG
jgi:cellulose synthase/poly-beta-1,6-N-acetylglucosamine synthase-like glycosyltransferase